MSIAIDDLANAAAAGFIALLFTAPSSVVIGVVIYQAIDNADTSFIEKCVKAGAPHKACFEVTMGEEWGRKKNGSE